MVVGRPAVHRGPHHHRVLRGAPDPGPGRAGRRAARGRRRSRCLGAGSGPSRGTLTGVIAAQLDALEAELRTLGRVVVAFSGGADSAFLAAMAQRTLGRDAVHAVTAVSPSLAGAERDDCR